MHSTVGPSDTKLCSGSTQPNLVGLRRRRALSVLVGVGDGRRVTSTYKFHLLGGSVGMSYEETYGLRQLTEWSMRVQDLNSQSRSLRGEI